MFITLTNANTTHRGSPVVLNSAHIVSIARTTITRPPVNEGDDAVVEDITFIYCPPHGTWEVSETIEEVVKLLA